MLICMEKNSLGEVNYRAKHPCYRNVNMNNDIIQISQKFPHFILLVQYVVQHYFHICHSETL